MSENPYRAPQEDEPVIRAELVPERKPLLPFLFASGMVAVIGFLLLLILHAAAIEFALAALVFTLVFAVLLWRRV